MFFLNLLFLLLASTPASPPSVGFIGVWDRTQPILADAGRTQKMPVSFFRPAEILSDASRRKEAERCRLLFVLNLESGEAHELVGWARSMNGRGVRIIPLDSRGSHVELEKAGVLTNDPELTKYWRPNGAINIRRMFAYIAAHYFGIRENVEPPVLVPDYGFYDRENEEPFPDFEKYKAFKKSHRRWHDDAPTTVILIQQSFWVTHDTKVIDAQARALEARGINTAIVFGDTQDRVESMVRQAKPVLLIEDRHGAMWENHSLLEQLDVRNNQTEYLVSQRFHKVLLRSPDLTVYFLEHTSQ